MLEEEEDGVKSGKYGDGAVVRKGEINKGLIVKGERHILFSKKYSSLNRLQVMEDCFRRIPPKLGLL